MSERRGPRDVRLRPRRATNRLRSRDVVFLDEESPSTPTHNATIEIFDPGDSGFDYAGLVDLVQDRIAFVPRYRQRIQTVPGHLANPVWVDDDHFDIGYHVRRSALPRPGTLDQLRELTARIVSRPLDRTRPLWEMYFVEGLADGRVAVLSKSHQVLVDGVQTVDLGQVLLDAAPERKELGTDSWRPRGRPSPLSLVAGALHDSLTDPRTVLETVRSRSDSALRGAGATARTVGEAMDAFTSRGPAPYSPMGRPLSQQRHIVGVSTDLADYRRIRDVLGGTVNDAILATVTGALRAWLMTRGESLRGIRQIRALVPVSVIDDELEPTSLGSQIAPHIVDLPVWEASPVVRLHQVSYSFQVHSETGRAVGADRLAALSGFAPATFHAIGTRMAALERRRGYQISVTNVPGPQSPLYAAGARMLATYPVPPLLEGHPLAVGVTSYDGQVYYGITTDRELPGADVLGSCVREALDELVEAASGGRPRAPRGRGRGARTRERP